MEGLWTLAKEADHLRGAGNLVQGETKVFVNLELGETKVFVSAAMERALEGEQEGEGTSHGWEAGLGACRGSAAQ